MEYPTPTNGQPFYCVKCGAGFGEYMACEMPDCFLENHEAALRRSAKPEPEDAG